MKMKTKFSALMACAALIMVSCSSPAPKPMDMDALKVEIQAMEDAFSTAEKAKDAAGVAVYYADDAISYGRNNEPQVGKEAIKSGIASSLAKDTLNLTNVYKVVDIFAEGNKAIEIGSWQKIDSEGKEKDRGHYMSYFEKRDGKYVCVRDMNVSSIPVKPAGM